MLDGSLPLRFVDSTNIFPAGLSKLIEDCKTSCRGRDPGEAFPLLAERHPLFAAAQKQAHPLLYGAAEARAGMESEGLGAPPEEDSDAV